MHEHKERGRDVKKAMQVLLMMMLVTAGMTAIFEGSEQALLLLVMTGFTGQGYQLMCTSHDNPGDSENQSRKLKAVEVFTAVCGFISFYWPNSVGLNVGIALCLIFYCVGMRYMKEGTAEA